MTGNLMVKDAEYQELSSAYKNMVRTIKNNLKNYLKYSEAAAESVEGLTGDNMRLFALQVRFVQMKAETLLTEVGTDIDAFVPDIDDKDQSIYV